MRTYALLFAAALLLFVTGCSKKSNEPEPPEIRLGEDACDECRMIINEQRFAAAITTANGEVRRFDDIGGMLIYDKKHNEDVARYWVSSYTSDKWLNAAEAYFISSKSKELDTPMAYGIIAVENESEASELSKEYDGKVMNFKQIRELDFMGNLN